MKYDNILLIDDDADDQEIFIAAVNEVSALITCNTITDASEALKQLLQHKIQPELIFLDLNMPVMSGEQFLIEIKKQENLKNIPVIVYSTSSHTNTVSAMKDLGARDFITKPNKFDKLVEILNPFLGY